MEPIDTLIAARWVIPIEPGGRVLDGHAVAIHHGRIVAVVPADEARQRFLPREIVERPAHVLLPGFVNAHAHAAASLLRGVAGNVGYERWSQRIRSLQRRWMDAEYVRDGAELAIAAALGSGTTCFADAHLFPEVVAQVAAAARMRACIGLPVLDGPTVWAGSAGEYLDKGLQLHDEYRDDPLITTALAPFEPASVSDETLIRVRRAADELELPMTLHVDAHGAVGHEPMLVRLQRLGLLSPLLSAVHATGIDAADVERIAAAGASVVHCPRSNLKLGRGICPVPLLKERGVNVALGSGDDTNFDLLDEVRSGALLATGLSPTGSAIGAHDWLRIATLNGAQALGLGETVGSLLPGKWADLCCINLDRANTQPVYDPAEQVVFAASREQVSDVWVAGRTLVREGRLTNLDLDDVLSRARRWAARIGEPTRPS
jgi:5-methylthioadenosine/S-adenosylhomocysteine deaminase